MYFYSVLIVSSLIALLSACQNIENKNKFVGIGLGSQANSDGSSQIKKPQQIDFNELLDKKEQRLSQVLRGTTVQVKRDLDGRIHIIMPSATFSSNSAMIQPRFQPLLDKIAAVLQEDNSINKLSLLINGHTDSSGNDLINNPLSQSRANVVLHYLSTKGIANSRMAARGYGSTTPIADNATAVGREMNRRVEISIDSSH